MPRSLPPLNAIRAFEAAGRHESFTGAADELGVSHSAISRHVRGLEDRLGTQLFKVASRGVRLTQAGQRYLDEVTPALDAIATASDVFAAKPKGVLTVDAEPLFAMKWLIPRLGDFHARHPDIELRLDANRNLVDVARYEADMAIRFFKNPEDVTNEPLVSNAPLHPYAAPHLFDLGDLKPIDLLKHQLFKDRATPTWERWFHLAGVAPHLIPNDPWRMRTSLALEAAIAGQGVILIGADLAESAVADGKLVKCFDIGFRMGSYHLVIGDGAKRRPAVRVFKDWVLDQSRDLRQLGHA